MPLSHDSRPRFKYTLPDGRMILVIHDHGETPSPMTSFELRIGDALWDKAQRQSGSGRRFVLATLAEGL